MILHASWAPKKFALRHLDSGRHAKLVHFDNFFYNLLFERIFLFFCV